MALNPQTLKRRNEDIIKAFNKLCNIKTRKGNRQLSYEAIVEKLAWDFYLNEHTIEQIIKKS